MRIPDWLKKSDYGRPTPEQRVKILSVPDHDRESHPR